MTTPNFNNGIFLAPGAKISQDLQAKIKQISEDKPKFTTYSKRVRELFNLDQITIDETQNNFLAGFIEGEGSFSISVKKNPNAKFGLELDPNFNITQHINGVKHLYLALEIFQVGRIRYKAGSNATLSFIIESRKSLQEKVCPFLKKYVFPQSSKAKQIRYKTFTKLLDLFDDNAHLDKERFINELLPLWDLMRVQKGFKGETFKTLEEAQDFVRNFKP